MEAALKSGEIVEASESEGEASTLSVSSFMAEGMLSSNKLEERGKTQPIHLTQNQGLSLDFNSS